MATQIKLKNTATDSGVSLIIEQAEALGWNPSRLGDVIMVEAEIELVKRKFARSNAVDSVSIGT